MNMTFSSKNYVDIFDSFLFGKPRYLVFNTKNTKDMMPSFWEETDEGYKCTCRTVGIAPKDVKIEIKSDCISVSGQTEFDGYEYNTKYELPISNDVLNNIKKVKCKSENGISIIYLEVNKPEKNKIDIEYI